MLKKVIRYLGIRWERFKILQKFFGKKKNKKNKSIVVFDIKAPNIFSRHLVNPTLFFLKKNYSVVFRLRYNLINQIGYYYNLINRNPNVRIAFKRPHKPKYVLTNKRASSCQIELKPDMFGLENYEQNSHRIPPPMHPLTYEESTYDQLLELNNSLKNNRRNYKIVFAGNLIEDGYKSFEWGNEFYINRVELKKEINKNFSDEVFIPKSYKQYQTGSKKKICIVDRKYFSLKLMDYFTLLSDGDFAFCPPGIRQPFCHNLIEAMFCGSIPILQYGHLMPVSVLHTKNSISYSSTDSLMSSIENVLTMDEPKIDEMRDSVTESYVKYLKPESVVTNFEREADAGLKTLYIPAGT